MSDASNIFKIWGQRRRILLTETSEIDLVYLKKYTFCSTHSHSNKINRFIVLSGKVRIESEYGSQVLKKDEVFEVRPSLIHRFYAEEDSVMIECAYVEQSVDPYDKYVVIDPNDIDRISQGGRIIQGKEMTLDEMRERGILDL